MTTGKRLGLIIFYYMLLVFSITIISEFFDKDTNMIEISEMVLKAFMFVFGVVFGSGITKKIVNKGKDSEKNNNNLK